jgi:hypothetical protein
MTKDNGLQKNRRRARRIHQSYPQSQPQMLQMLLNTLPRPSADEFDRNVPSRLIQKSSLFGAIQTTAYRLL